jgi:TRAP-type C4-dicarboxylate transport system substrate-binding protein
MNMENVRNLVDKLKQEGMQVNMVQNQAAFQQKVKSVYEEFRPSIGDEIYDLVMGQM